MANEIFEEIKRKYKINVKINIGTICNQIDNYILKIFIKE